jgi:hypothetical protein
VILFGALYLYWRLALYVSVARFGVGVLFPWSFFLIFRADYLRFSLDRTGLSIDVDICLDGLNRMTLMVDYDLGFGH